MSADTIKNVKKLMMHHTRRRGDDAIANTKADTRSMFAFLFLTYVGGAERRMMTWNIGPYHGGLRGSGEGERGRGGAGERDGVTDPGSRGRTVALRWHALVAISHLHVIMSER